MSADTSKDLPPTSMYEAMKGKCIHRVHFVDTQTGQPDFYNCGRPAVVDSRHGWLCREHKRVTENLMRTAPVHSHLQREYEVDAEEILRVEAAASVPFGVQPLRRFKVREVYHLAQPWQTRVDFITLNPEYAKDRC